MVVLNDLEVDVELADGSVANLREQGRFFDFTLNMGLPSWRYEIDGVVIEKSIAMPSRQNIVHITFRSLGDGGRVRLRLRPLVNFRPLEAPVGEALSSDYTLTVRVDRYEIGAGPDLPVLRLAVENSEGPTFTADGGSRREHFYDIEAQRGYDARGWLWSPGYFSGEVGRGSTLTLVAATEAWHTVLALSPDDALTFEGERCQRLVGMAAAPARIGFAAELVLAADAFVTSPVGRIADGARARAEGDEVRTVIAGYHWFTDWGRDTMISLEGLGALDPAHLCSLRARRPDSEPVPGRKKSGPLPHRRCDIVVLPRAAPLCRLLRGQGNPGPPAADPEGHRPAPSRWHPLRHQGRPA
jgi:predicted glycogen debranching enzyme